MSVRHAAQGPLTHCLWTYIARGRRCTEPTIVQYPIDSLRHSCFKACPTGPNKVSLSLLNALTAVIGPLRIPGQRSDAAHVTSKLLWCHIRNTKPDRRCGLHFPFQWRQFQRLQCSFRGWNFTSSRRRGWRRRRKFVMWFANVYTVEVLISYDRQLSSTILCNIANNKARRIYT